MPDNGWKRLDRILGLRKRLEEERTAELGMAQLEEGEAAGLVQTLEDRRTEVHELMSRRSSEKVGKLQTLNVVLEQLDHGLHNARMTHEVAANRVVQTVERLADAHRDRKALERVVDRRQDNARAELKAQERKQDDEVALNSFRTAAPDGRGEVER